MTLPPKPSQGECKCSQFFENQPNKISSHLSQKLQKCRLFGPDMGSKITLTKEKERRKRKSEEKDRKEGEEEKSNGGTLSFYIGYFGDSFWPEKNCWTQKVHLAVTFSKIRLEIRYRFPAP